MSKGTSHLVVPPCASWDVWVGSEIEGIDSLGEPTVFVRRLDGKLNEMSDYSFMTRGGRYRRVWFCKEFTKWAILSAIASVFVKVVIEVDMKSIFNVPRKFLDLYQIYFKLPVELKKGDVICVGPAFADESFVIGTGRKVTPDMYKKDVRIL